MSGTEATQTTGPMVGKYYRQDLVKGVSGRSHPSSVFGVFGGIKKPANVIGGGCGRSSSLSQSTKSVNSFVLNRSSLPNDRPQLANTGNYKGAIKGLDTLVVVPGSVYVPLNGVSSRNLSNIYQYRGTYYGFQGNSNVSGPTSKK